MLRRLDARLGPVAPGAERIRAETAGPNLALRKSKRGFSAISRSRHGSERATERDYRPERLRRGKRESASAALAGASLMNSGGVGEKAGTGLSSRTRSFGRRDSIKERTRTAAPNKNHIRARFRPGSPSKGRKPTTTSRIRSAGVRRVLASFAWQKGQVSDSDGPRARPTSPPQRGQFPLFAIPSLPPPAAICWAACPRRVKEQRSRAACLR